LEQFMRLTRLFALVAALSSVAIPAWSQTPRLQFLNRPKDDTTLSGAITIKVSTDPILRPKGIRPGIKVDGELRETSETLPWIYVWDSTNAPDGKHVIQLVLVNSRTGESGTVDEMRIRTSNRVLREPSPPPVPEDLRPTSREDHRDDKRAHLGNQDLVVPPARRKSDDEGAQPDEAASVSRAANALEFDASSLQVASGKILIGRRDSSLSAFDPASRDGWTVKAPVAAGETTWAARGGEISAWICADAASDRRSGSDTPARWLFVYNEKDKRVKAIDLTGSPVPVRRISLWMGRIVLTGPSGGSVCDPATGVFSDIESLLSGEERPSVRDADTYFASEGGKAVLAALGRGGRGYSGGPSVQPGELALWMHDGKAWTQMQSPALSELENVRALALSTEGIGVFPNNGIASITLGTNRGDLLHEPYPQSDQTWRATTQFAVSGPHLWSLRGNTLFHLDSRTGKMDAFLPWNIQGLAPSRIAADGDQLWIGTNQGIKRLQLSRPDSEIGYGGFVRARLGTEQDGPSFASAQRLTEEIDSWQGTPYLWGGESRSGIDCSGFVMRAFQGVGVRLSHGSAWLKTCDMGRVVKDELAYGDVLVIPGHCMIYTGDGTTAETVSKAVGRASIWRRGYPVLVRRFLSAPGIETTTFASRSTGYAKQTSNRKKEKR
jgi:cell wall-associated NlpC family hydrolase